MYDELFGFDDVILLCGVVVAANNNTSFAAIVAQDVWVALWEYFCGRNAFHLICVGLSVGIQLLTKRIERKAAKKAVREKIS